MQHKSMKHRMRCFCVGALATSFLAGTSGAAFARPSWTGKLSAKPASFNAFMKRSVGKTVDINITFDGSKQEGTSGGVPYTSLGGDSGPIFMVGGDLYRVENGGNEYNWRTLMGYNKNKRQLIGTFGVSGGHKSGEDPGYIYDLRWRPNFKRDVKVTVADENGKILLRSSGITLRGGHIQVPVRAYKLLSFEVRRDIETGKVTIGTPERYNKTSPDTTTFDTVYNSVTYDKNGSETKLFTDFKPPVVLLQNGEFFVPPSLVQKRFDAKITTKWDAKTRTITLRRTQAFADQLRAIYDHV